MTNLDPAAITARRASAEALLAGGYYGDPDRAETDLNRLVTEDVPAVLLELEARTNAADEGYVRGMSHVVPKPRRGWTRTSALAAGCPVGS